MPSRLREEIFSSLKVVGEDSEGEYGYFPDERPVHELLRYGFIPLDKPAGQLSHQVVAWVRRIAGVDSAGHSGTLDPMATGLLPIAINDATKALSTLLLGPKEYYAVMRLHSPVPDKELQQVLNEFTGEIYQRPPQRSSVRRVTRTRVCSISEQDGLVRLQELALAFNHYREKGEDKMLRQVVWPIERAVRHLKSIVVKDSAVDPVCHGAMLAVPGLARISMDIEKGDTVAIYTQKAELVGFGLALMNAAEMEDAEKGFVVKVNRVVMPAGSYPHYRKGAELKQQLQA